MRIFILILTISSLVLFTACGGGGSGGSDGSGGSGESGGSGGGGNSPVTGRIYPPVQGVNYRTPSKTAVTGRDGTFSFKEGETISFSVGAISTVASSARKYVTPVDLFGGDTDDTDVKNFMRFLMMLDTDEDPTDGISISSNVQGVAGGWTQPDFASVTFDTDIAGLLLM